MRRAPRTPNAPNICTGTLAALYARIEHTGEQTAKGRGRRLRMTSLSYSKLCQGHQALPYLWSERYTSAARTPCHAHEDLHRIHSPPFGVIQKSGPKTATCCLCCFPETPLPPPGNDGGGEAKQAKTKGRSRLSAANANNSAGGADSRGARGRRLYLLRTLYLP